LFAICFGQIVSRKFTWYYVAKKCSSLVHRSSKCQNSAGKNLSSWTLAHYTVLGNFDSVILLRFWGRAMFIILDVRVHQISVNFAHSQNLWKQDACQNFMFHNSDNGVLQAMVQNRKLTVEKSTFITFDNSSSDKMLPISMY